MKKCIVCGASPEGFENASNVDFSNSFVIAVDGGYNLAIKLGLEPNVLIGDFDSLSDKNILPKALETITLPKEKDDTDLMFAARFIVENKFDEALFLGVTGGRLDHFLGSLAILSFLTNNNVRTTILDNYTKTFFLKPGVYKIDSNEYKYFSLLPYGGHVEGVTLDGAKYPLSSANLTTDFPLGISNEFLNKKVEVKFSRGDLLFVLAKE